MRDEILQHAKILIVDDQPDNIGLLQHLLRVEGYFNLQSTSDPRDVRRLFSSVQPDLIVLDLMMPHLNGFQVMEQLKPLMPEAAAVPILVITGDSLAETRHRALAAGARDFLTKPFDATEVVLRVMNLLEIRFLQLRLQRQNESLQEKVRERTAELMEANAALQESNDQLFAVVDAVPGGVSWISADLRYLGINRHLAGTYNLPPQAFIGQPVGFLSNSPAFAEFVRGLFAQSDPAARQEVDIKIEGSPHTYLIAGHKYQQGKVAVFIGIDISERKRAEAALQQAHDELESRVRERTAELARANAELLSENEARQRMAATLMESQQRLQALFDNTQDSILLTDDDRRYIDANPAASALLGYTRDELLQMTIQDVLPGVTHTKVLAAWQAFLAEGRQSGEMPLLHKDGTLVETEFRAVANIVPGLHLSVVRDITTRKADEAALQQAKEEAERANRAKSEFLSRMSHELRTPLNAILGFAQLFELDDLAEEERENVEQIQRAGSHLLALINEVLEIARIEAGRMALSLEAVDVAEAVAEVLSLMQTSARENDIALHHATEAGPFHAVADSQRLKQVLLNLVSNAIKYNRPSGSVHISCAPSGAEYLRLEVRDTGPGISPDDLPKLFVPFERLGADRRGIEGSGIGLSLTKGLVEIMGGQIGVQSTVGEGSIFWVELTQAQSPDMIQASPDPSITQDSALETGHAVRTVLYVEDNLSNLKLIEHILVQHPHIRLLAAMQGSIGLELAVEHQPDLILLDLHLPDFNGDEVLRRLQADPAMREIPVIMLSADATPHQIERLLAAGAVDYLTKPLNVQQFLQVLHDRLYT